MADVRTSRSISPDLRPGTAGGSYAPPAVSPTDPGLEQQASQRPTGPSYFGYHTDSSIQARLAQQGIPPTAVNIKVAQQMLRYGLPLSATNLMQLAQLWQGLGLSMLNLDALLALFSLGLPVSDVNLALIQQLLSGGPASHLLARLTMLLRNGSMGMTELQALLAQYWKLGSGDLMAELARFEDLQARLLKLLDQAGGRLPQELASELDALRKLFDGQQLLARQEQAIYLPFYTWQEQQPMPAELMVQADRDAREKAAGFVNLTLGVDTRNLGRVTMNFTLIRGHLSLKLEVGDAAVKGLVEASLSGLRARLTSKTSYTIANVGCAEVGDGRSTSILLPRRRNIKRLGRVIGVL